MRSGLSGWARTRRTAFMQLAAFRQAPPRRQSGGGLSSDFVLEVNNLTPSQPIHRHVVLLCFFFAALFSAGAQNISYSTASIFSAGSLASE